MTDTYNFGPTVPALFAAHEARYEKLANHCKELERQLASKQAEVDALMLEFCPEELTREQVEEWAKHQKPAALTATEGEK